MKITEARRVKVKFTIEGEDDKKSQTEELVVYKVNGKWVLEDSILSILKDFRD